jgi:2-polyprenyl-3-methyl-5-hydroxy-6-metoxy-1,4-benzoquinol methylase
VRDEAEQKRDSAAVDVGARRCRDAEGVSNDAVIDEHVRRSIVKTHGNLYRGAALTRYPIPPFPLGPGEGRALLDIGCNWGRWTLAAARAGYRATGIDPSRKAVEAARRVAEQLDLDAEYVVGDARELSLADGSFDVVFSYSVLQHLAKEDVRRVIAELRRVLRPGGQAWIEMPNARGPLNVARRLARGSAAPIGTDVRYWTPAELREAFGALGRVELAADGFLTINPQPADLDLLPVRSRVVVRVSEALRRASERAPFLVGVADSLVVKVQSG